MNKDCNADLGHPCDANEGEPCDSCVVERAYWRVQCGRQYHYTRAEIEDVYSDPTDAHKREVMLREENNYESGR